MQFSKFKIYNFGIAVYCFWAPMCLSFCNRFDQGSSQQLQLHDYFSAPSSWTPTHNILSSFLLNHEMINLTMNSIGSFCCRLLNIFYGLVISPAFVYLPR